MRKPFPAGMEMMMWEGYTMQSWSAHGISDARFTAVNLCKELLKGYIGVYKLWQAWNKCQVQVGDWVVIVT